MKLRKLFDFRSAMKRSAVFLTVDSVLSLVATFFIYRVFIATRGIDELGVWVLIISYTGVIGAADISGSGGLARFVSITRIGGRPGKTAADFVDTVTLLVAALFLVAAPIAYFPLRYLLQSATPEQFHHEICAVLAIALASSVTVAVAQATAGALDGVKRADLRAGIQILGRFTLISSALVLVPRYGATGMALAKFLEGLVLLLAARFLISRMIEDVSLLPRRFHKAAASESISYGGRLQFYRILNILVAPLTNTLITQHGGLAALAIFDLANRSVDRLRNLAKNAAMPLVPAFTEHAHLNPAEGIILLQKATGIILTMAAAVIAASVVGAPVLSWLFLGQVDTSFVVVMAILAPAQYSGAMAISMDLYARGLGRLRWNIFGALAVLATVAGLGLSLGPIAGGTGIVAAVAVAMFTGSVTTIVGNAWMLHVRPLEVFPPRTIFFGIVIVSLSILMVLQYG